MDTYPGISSAQIKLRLWSGLIKTGNRKGRLGLSLDDAVTSQQYLASLALAGLFLAQKKTRRSGSSVLQGGELGDAPAPHNESDQA